MFFAVVVLIAITTNMTVLCFQLCNVLVEEEQWEDLSEVSLLGLTCPAFVRDPAKVKVNVLVTFSCGAFSFTSLCFGV